jgi:hypothetical protein
VVAGPAICPPSVGCQYVPLRVGLTDGDVDRVWLGDDQLDLLVGETGPLSPAHAQLTAEGRGPENLGALDGNGRHVLTRAGCGFNVAGDGRLDDRQPLRRPGKSLKFPYCASTGTISIGNSIPAARPMVLLA